MVATPFFERGNFLPKIVNFIFSQTIECLYSTIMFLDPRNRFKTLSEHLDHYFGSYGHALVARGTINCHEKENYRNFGNM